MTPTEYLNAAKQALDVSSDYALAKALDVPKQKISDYYKGKWSPDDETCARLALALNLPIGEVLADIRAQTAKTDKAREFWRSFLGRMRQAGAILSLVIYGAFCAQGPWLYAAGAGRFKGRFKP